jgi:hypothetical protein
VKCGKLPVTFSGPSIATRGHRRAGPGKVTVPKFHLSLWDAGEGTTTESFLKLQVAEDEIGKPVLTSMHVVDLDSQMKCPVEKAVVESMAD